MACAVARRSSGRGGDRLDCINIHRLVMRTNHEAIENQGRSAVNRWHGASPEMLDAARHGDGAIRGGRGSTRIKSLEMAVGSSRASRLAQ